MVVLGKTNFWLLVAAALSLHLSATHADDSQPVSLTQIDLRQYVCTDTAQDVGRFGLPSCSTLISDGVAGLATYLRDTTRQVLVSYYDGKLVFPDYSDKTNSPNGAFCVAVDSAKNPIVIPKPTCNIADPVINAGKGESDKNFLGEECAGASAGLPESKGLCDMKDFEGKGGSFDKICPKESAWFKSIRAQIWQSKTAEVINNDLAKRVLHLTETDPGVYPCAVFAQQLAHLVKGDAAPLTGLSTAFSGLDPVRALLKDINAKADPSLRFDEKKACDAQAFSSGSGIEAQFGNASLAVCDVIYGQRYAELQFKRVAACEVALRSQRAYYDAFYSQDSFFEKLFNELFIPCRMKAQVECDIDSNFAHIPPPAAPSGGSSSGGIPPMSAGTPPTPEGMWTNSCFRNSFYSCYRTGVGSGSSFAGVEDFFRRTIREAVPLKKEDGLFPFNGLKAPGGGDVVIDKNCAGLFLLPFGWRKRKGSPASKKSKLTLLIVIAAVAALLMSPLAQAGEYEKTISFSCSEGNVIGIKLDETCVAEAYSKSCFQYYNLWLASDEAFIQMCDAFLGMNSSDQCDAWIAAGDPDATQMGHDGCVSWLNNSLKPLYENLKKDIVKNRDARIAERDSMCPMPNPNKIGGAVMTAVFESALSVCNEAALSKAPEQCPQPQLPPLPPPPLTNGNGPQNEGEKSVAHAEALVDPDKAKLSGTLGFGPVSESAATAGNGDKPQKSFKKSFGSGGSPLPPGTANPGVGSSPTVTAVTAPAAPLLGFGSVGENEKGSGVASVTAEAKAVRNREVLLGFEAVSVGAQGRGNASDGPDIDGVPGVTDLDSFGETGANGAQGPASDDFDGDVTDGLHSSSSDLFKIVHRRYRKSATPRVMPSDGRN